MIAEKAFLVLLAEDLNGKKTILESLVKNANGGTFGRKGAKSLIFSGETIESYIFRCSFQGSEKNKYGNPLEALQANVDNTNNQRYWYEKELIVMPSRANYIDVRQMVNTASFYGYRTILAYILMNKDINKDFHLESFSKILSLNWSKRWELLNPVTTEWKSQCSDIGLDLFYKLDNLYLKGK